MGDPVQPRLPRRPSRERGRVPEEDPDWRRLLRRGSIHDVLEDVALWLAPRGACEFVLEDPDEPCREVAAVRRATAGGALSPGTVARVPGEPEWRLRVAVCGSRGVGKQRLTRAASAIGAWRAARSEASRADARTRELDLLQLIARGAAEARTPDELFASAADALHRTREDEFIAVVHALGGEPEFQVFLGRPVADDLLSTAAYPCSDVLGWTLEQIPKPTVLRLDGFDAGRGQRAGIRDEDLIVLPLSRRGRPVAAVAVLPAAHSEEGAVRLLFGAANHLALHLDRILTVREAEEGRFREILESMPHAVLLTGPGLRLVDANPAARALLLALGVEPAGAVLERIGSLDLRALAEELVRTGRPSARAEARTSDGTVLDATLSRAAGGASGRPGLVLVLSDVTESRRLQEHLAQAEKLSSLGQMISGIAHELNNPLASVLGYAQLVRDASHDERLVRRLEVIDREAKRCQRIVQNLLSFARRHEPERRPLPLNQVVESVLGLLGYQLRVDGVRVVTELDGDIGPIRGDAHQLQQALLNLLTNAQHALRARDGGTIWIRTSSCGARGIQLEVEDDGPGIPDDLRSRVFDPFFTTKSPGDGTGLGLSIVYGIVASHDGTIEARARVGGGAHFVINLPSAAGSQTEQEPLAAAGGDGHPFAGRILVVDDEEHVAGLIREALAEDGHEAVAVQDAAEALDRLAVEEFDAVVADVRIPGMTVENLCGEIKRLRPGMMRRLLLTTGDTLGGGADAFAERESIAIVHKPFDLDDLRGAVRSLLSRGRGRGSCAT